MASMRAQFAGRLDVDRFQIERDGALELGVGFADAGEDDLPRARSRRARATSISHMELGVDAAAQACSIRDERAAWSSP